MRSVVFRLLAGIIGACIVLVAFPVSKYSDGSFWPVWLLVLSFLTLGVVFLIYAITGRAWPSSYGEDIFRNDSDLNDR